MTVNIRRPQRLSATTRISGIVESSKNGNNTELGQLLWQLSESLTGTRLDCGTPWPAL